MSSLPASIKRIGSKTTAKRCRHCFPHYKSMGAFCFHGNQSFDPICLKTLCDLSPTLMMLHLKFDQHWPTGLRDIQVSSELWQNHRIPEGQGKFSIAPLFQSGAIINEPCHEKNCLMSYANNKDADQPVHTSVQGLWCLLPIISIDAMPKFQGFSWARLFELYLVALTRRQVFLRHSS